jgi:hypothetical protein
MDAHRRRLRELGYSEQEINQPRQNFFGGSGIVLFGGPNESSSNSNSAKASASQNSSQRAGGGQAAGRSAAPNGNGGFNPIRNTPPNPFGNGFNLPGFGSGFNLPGFGDGGNILDNMLTFQTKRTVLNDHKFSIEHPLLSMNEFVKRPQLLVGNEKTAFVSVGSGPPPATGKR